MNNINDSMVAGALALADTEKPSVEPSPKELLRRRIISALRNRDEFSDTENFNELVAIMKLRDKQLEKDGYTDCHPSRYTLVKLIEEADNILRH